MASAALVVKGGTPAQAQALESAYSAFPPACRTDGTVCVCLLSDHSMDSCLQACAAAHSQKMVNPGAVDGFFDCTSGVITLRDVSTTSDVSATFAHEYGHFVWANILTPAQRDRYGAIYRTQRSAHHLISQYAAVSVQEGFAEAFSFYIRDQACLAKADPLSCVYLTSLLPPRKPA